MPTVNEILKQNRQQLARIDQLLKWCDDYDEALERFYSREVRDPARLITLAEAGSTPVPATKP